MAGAVPEIGFKRSYVVLLLQLLDRKATTDPLLKLGLSYTQIVDLISHAQAEGYIESTSGGFVLSGRGKEYLRFTEEGKERHDGAWISPALEEKVAPSSSADVYLPPKRSLKWLVGGRGH